MAVALESVAEGSQEGKWGERGFSGSGAVVFLNQERRMVCVEYPGLVKDVGKMLDTLGRDEGVSKTYADPTKRLELWFRPKDPYCHPFCANRFSSTSMLLRVKRKTRRRRPKEESDSASTQEEEIKYEMEILGLIGTTYKFQGMSDFQYLATRCGPDGQQVSMYNKLLLNKPEKMEFFNQDIPLFIPPAIFSRLDNPVDYYYRPDIQHREGNNPPQVSRENLIGLSRARRPHNAIFVSFEDAEAPSQPLDAALQNWKKTCTHANDKKAEEHLKKLFERRPVWSRNALKANIEIHPEKLKMLLPSIAYYMLTGPWRSMWVRFGYDPRKDPKAKIYQVLDFRIRCGMKHGYTPNDMPVKAKRSTYNYSLPITIKKTTPQPVSVKDLTEGLSSLESPTARKPTIVNCKLDDSIYIFRGGTLPPYRQMFYQFCDLDVESSVVYSKAGRREGAARF
ncbi:general transcription factor 3C polypeptide 5 isoform X2 [Latimeria chalumnae]|uniref:general transcription factor 3C polypeptide 5 isoform X2 n=1 Tax=Latimeria chalumnae TaxID=7897 RepID=UPI0003C181B4|nr:PREDICTED: general transcription factor 3C polypeptide 5 isoform X2 [Latimeria chalumnae]|eukprot:XP_005990686.1 PREDICTED: general transcription factor 3C polypeptide 5 isoform X2 [Latimeria chalumnae]